MVLALYISFLSTIIMGIYVLRIKEKMLIHWAFLANILCMFVWGSGYVLDSFFRSYPGYIGLLSNDIVYIGVTFFPITLWFTGLVFKNNNPTKPNYKYLLLFIIPIISNIMLWTNQYHHLFYKEFYSVDTSNNVYGSYFFFVHAIYSYTFIILWVFNMTIYALRNGGILFKQVILAVTGTVVFLLVNVLFMLNVGIITSAYWNIISFAIMMLCYLVAIVKYNFLNIIPIAREKIMDSIADGFVVLDSGLKVQDINKSFIETFKDILFINVGDNFSDFLIKNRFLKITPERFKETLEKSVSGEHILPFEIHILKDKFNKWFSVTVWCIDKDKDIGCIVTFRDITYEKHHEIISMERTKLRGFVQIAGDLAHDINTPLIVINTCAANIEIALKKYKENPNQLINEYDWLEQMIKVILTECDNSSKVANKLRWQTTYIYDEERTEFVLYDLVLRAIKWSHEIANLWDELNCKYSIHTDNTELKLLGYPENLTKVLTNIIKNAIESYRGKNIENKTVEIIITQQDEQENMVTIAVKDFGVGICEKLQRDILKNPLKTKNLKPDGGGLSLFLAPLIVTGQLQGKIWFESKEGKGSTFYISIPIACREREHEKE